MDAIFPIIAIFILVIILFFLSQIVIQIVWHYKAKFNSTKTIETVGIAIALFVLFMILMLAIFSAINIFANAEDSSSTKTEVTKVIDEIDETLNLEDCQKLINKIYLGESQIYNLENHRYLEVVATSKNINQSYQEGAEKLKFIADQYLDLDINLESKYYSEILANKLQEKAQLFKERSRITTNTNNRPKINQLLDEMDRVTQARLKAIESIENKCNLINN